MIDHSPWLKRVALGAASGLAGTLVMHTLMSADKKWLPNGQAPIRQNPGEFMVKKAEEMLPDGVRRHIPQKAESGAAAALGVAYGITFGALYGALRPDGGSPPLDGVALGIACWGAGYLGWLPACGLMPPVWKQRPPQALTPVAEHAVYGVATVGAYDWLCEHV